MRILVFWVSLFLSLSSTGGFAQGDSKFSGELSVLIYDYFEEERSETKYFLNSLEVKPLNFEASDLEIKFQEGDLPFVTGSKIEINCLFFENDICHVGDWSSLEGEIKTFAKAPAEIDTLWILVDVADVNVGLSLEQAEAKIEMTNNWFSQASYGKTQLNADVDEDGSYDLHRVMIEDYSKAENGCQQSTLRNAALTALQDQGVDITQHKYRVFIFPQLGCGWGGLGTLGCGSYCWSISQGGTWNLVYPHELGHNITMHHAATDPENDGSVNSEYGDGSCPMGNVLSSGHFNGSHTHQGGWVNAEEGTLQTIGDENGIFSLRPLSSESEGVKVYRLLKDKPYYLSYRQRGDFDKPKAKYTYGLSLHSQSGTGKSKYIATLAAGESFSHGGFVISSLTAEEDEATFSFDNCNEAPFLTVLNQDIRGVPGEELDVLFRLKNRQGEFCPSTQFNLSQQFQNDLQGVISQTDVTLAPGETVDIAIRVVVPHASGEYHVGIKVIPEGTEDKYRGASIILVANNETDFSPGLERFHYSGEWTQLPNFYGLEPDHISLVDQVELGEYEGEDHFALRFKGYIYLAAGAYTFRLDSDKSSRLKFKNAFLISHSALNVTTSANEKNFIISEDNYYPIEVQYFDDEGPDHLSLSIKEGEGDFVEIPSENLFHLDPYVDPVKPVLAYTQMNSPQIEDYSTVFQMTVPYCFMNPIPFVRLQTRRGAGPGVSEVSFVHCDEEGNSVFDVRFKEFEYMNKKHSNEVIGLLVAEEGLHQLEDGSLVEARELVGRGFWRTHTPNQDLMDKNPVFLTQALEATQDLEDVQIYPKLVRLKVTPESFKYKLQFEEALLNAGETPKAQVGLLSLWAAPGSSLLTHDLVRDHNWDVLDSLPSNVYEKTYFPNLSSSNGYDPAYIEVTRDSSTALKLRVREEKSADLEDAHLAEEVDLILFPEVSAVLMGTSL